MKMDKVNKLMLQTVELIDLFEDVYPEFPEEAMASPLWYISAAMARSNPDKRKSYFKLMDAMLERVGEERFEDYSDFRESMKDRLIQYIEERSREK